MAVRRSSSLTDVLASPSDATFDSRKPFTPFIQLSSRRNTKVKPAFKDVNPPPSWQNGADKCRRRGIPWKRCPQKRSDKSWHSRTFRVLLLHVLCESYSSSMYKGRRLREKLGRPALLVRDWNRLWCSMGHSGSALRISALPGVLSYHKIMLWLFVYLIKWRSSESDR